MSGQGQYPELNDDENMYITSTRRKFEHFLKCSCAPEGGIYMFSAQKSNERQRFLDAGLVIYDPLFYISSPYIRTYCKGMLFRIVNMLAILPWGQ